MTTNPSANADACRSFQPDAEATGAERIATEAKRIIESACHTRYQHVPHIDAEHETYDVDCSAFVGYVLSLVAPEHLDAIPTTNTLDEFPRAFEFFDFLSASRRGWRRVEKLEHARRGDLIAWRVGAIVPHEDTGHILVVARAPEFDPDTDRWTVHVYDSSDVPHFDDSRLRDGAYHTGVGAGAIEFETDCDGAPVAFRFGPLAACHRLPIAIARLEPECCCTHDNYEKEHE